MIDVTDRISRFHPAACAILALAFVLATAALPRALAQDMTKLKAGLEVWKTAGCPDCHGAFADGEKQRDEAPDGANLRTARIEETALRETIRCGRPGTGMPRFDKDAYRQTACYGKPNGPPPDDLYPTPRELSAGEIDDVIAYLRAKVIGHRKVTPEDCAFYYGEGSDSCQDDDNK
jgi:mono/diheme cytochrome c family protein